MSKMEYLLNKWLEEQSSSLITEGYRVVGKLGTCTIHLVHPNGNRIFITHDGHAGSIIKNRCVVSRYEPQASDRLATP